MFKKKCPASISLFIYIYLTLTVLAKAGLFSEFTEYPKKIWNYTLSVKSFSV